jgi:DNA polymerase-1
MSTYVETLPQQINPETGRVHTNYNQTIAATGRLSSTDPNLQNIPVRSRLGREVRRAFVADNHGPMKPYDEETVLFGADYSQMELRILAHFCQDPALVTAFREDRDVHSTTAAEVFGVPIEDVTPEQRSVAKTVNFGIIYGMQAFGLSRDTGMSRQDSQEFISRYYARFPGIRSYFDAILTQGVQDGYTATLFNRRRYLPDLSSRGPQRAAAERAAMNMPLQGAAADIMKLAMIEIDKQLQASRLKSRMLLQVHDELIFEAPVSEVADLADLVARTMVNVVELSVPLEVERKVGLNWGEMKPYAA